MKKTLTTKNYEPHRKNVRQSLTGPEYTWALYIPEGTDRESHPKSSIDIECPTPIMITIV